MPYVGDTHPIPWVFKDAANAVIDISTQTAIVVTLRKPDETTKITAAGALATDGTDGAVTYTTTAGQLDVAGRWRAQFVVTLASTAQYTSDDITIVVGSPL